MSELAVIEVNGDPGMQSLEAIGRDDLIDPSGRRSSPAPSPNVTHDLLEHPLHRLPKYGDGIGLHRVAFLMEACGLDSEDVYRSAIAITGSNGKGSTARIASALLSAAGGTVGLFTSPHLYSYNERFRIDGEPVDDARLLVAMDPVSRAPLKTIRRITAT